jgi:hypothetical protein
MEMGHTMNVTATVASFAQRESNLALVVEKILPQVDSLHVYLNDYSSVPAYLVAEKIKVFRGQTCAGDIKDNGKFYSVGDIEEGFHFVLDDDIVYPDDYVKEMVKQLEKFNLAYAMGVHGINHSPNADSYSSTDRQVIHFKEASGHCFVDKLGTGTVAYHTDTLQLDFSDFGSPGIADLWFALKARSSGIPLITAKRRAKWLQQQATPSENLYTYAKDNDEEIFRLFKSELEPLLRTDQPNGLPWFEKHRRHKFLERYGIRSRSAEYDWEVHAAADVLDIAVLVNGWNCEGEAEACLQSVHNQEIGRYKASVYVYDDGSDDATPRILEELDALGHQHLTLASDNRGPAFARHQLLKQVPDPHTVVVLLDLDDCLEPSALRVVAETYLDHPHCWMTFGNWRSASGDPNPLEFYESGTIDSRRCRTMAEFRGAPLRTFRRFLYECVREEDLQDDDGCWLRYCSDVALVLPMLEQCRARNVEFIDEVLYTYNQRRESGTLRKYGKPAKLKVLGQLQRRSLRPRVELDQLVESMRKPPGHSGAERQPE